MACRLAGKTTLALLVLTMMSCVGFGQDAISDLKKEIETLKQGQQLILQQLQLLLQRSPTPSTAERSVRGMEFEIPDNPVRGSKSAKLMLVDFTDYQCPFCGRYARETFPQILKEYVDTGKILYAIVDVPLPNHAMASKAAEASHCANEQGKFWEMHDQMMTKQDSLGNLSSYASSLSFDIQRFEDCLKTNKFAEKISKSMSVASQLGINGVPGFIIASIDPGNPTKLKAISGIRGAQPFSVFQKEIDSALADLQR